MKCEHEWTDSCNANLSHNLKGHWFIQCLKCGKLEMVNGKTRKKFSKEI